MAQEQEIAAQISSLKELLEIVAAIRAMAAVQMQQSQLARCDSRLLRTLFAMPWPRRRRSAACDAIEAEARPNKAGLVVFCSEHGFCGGFNEHQREADRAERQRGGLALIFVGTRGAQLCRERGFSPH